MLRRGRRGGNDNNIGSVVNIMKEVCVYVVLVRVIVVVVVVVVVVGVVVVGVVVVVVVVVVVLLVVSACINMSSSVNVM